MTGAAVFKTLVGNMSGPLALDGFTPCSSFCYSIYVHDNAGHILNITGV